MSIHNHRYNSCPFQIPGRGIFGVDDLSGITHTATNVSDKVNENPKPQNFHSTSTFLTMAERVRASHILCKHTGSRNPVSRRTGRPVTIDKNAAMTEIQGIISQVKNDPGKFALIAQERSDCGSFSRGGDLGFFGRGEMQKAFETAAFALKVGDISGVVDSDSGIHIIMRTG